MGTTAVDYGAFGFVVVVGTLGRVVWDVGARYGAGTDSAECAMVDSAGRGCRDESLL